MVRKKSLSELEKAEIKLETLVERRDALNQEAQLLRKERDLVHEKKRELTAVLREFRSKRAAATAEARAHRARRDELQGHAKELIEMRRKLRGRITGSVSDELRQLKRQIAQMEMRQQTATLSLSEENELLGDIKARMKQAKGLEILKTDQDKVFKEVTDIDGTITDLFARADAEHRVALDASAAARAIDEDLAPVLRSVGALIAEGDEKHEAYLETRAKADEVHAKVVEMRGKVLSERDAKRAEVREAREMLREQNRAVRIALLDKKKLEDSADEALRALLTKGRVEIGR
ncbi:MAG: hypothetical protein A3K68_06500 [Euryarchaeota archaeon RBG_16_68_13]|nr:MAG: hypothetical protein A3K68_06500 [Euryarchaeota archaeon RBG_16_68_13]